MGRPPEGKDILKVFYRRRPNSLAPDMAGSRARNIWTELQDDASHTPEKILQPAINTSIRHPQSFICSQKKPRRAQYLKKRAPVSLSPGYSSFRYPEQRKKKEKNQSAQRRHLAPKYKQRKRQTPSAKAIQAGLHSIRPYKRLLARTT